MHHLEDVNLFIYRSFLKKDEQLEMPSTLSESSFIEIDIVRRTARTRRKVGIFAVAREHYAIVDDPPDQELLRWTVGKRASLEENQQTLDWLHKGWILKEIRLKRDGKSVERIHYRMGYSLYYYLLNKQTDEYQLFLNQFTQYQMRASKNWSQLTYLHEERCLQLKELSRFLLASLQWSIESLDDPNFFPANWSLSKRINGLNFLLAFFMISSIKEIFDWKEIGARYYPGIGGSKAFDSNKEEFLNLLESISGQSLESLGMISGGQITSIYFAGELEGALSKFQAGPVHALTNLSVAHDQYSTRATTLWLVENRAVLTRMSAEPDFLKETNSFLLCVDGHLRSAHKHFITQLMQNSHILQTIFWSDYDEAGLQIAGEMHQSLIDHSVGYKWICPDHSIITNWSNYEQHMKSLLQYSKSEQEIMLGEADDWRSWINH